LSTSLGVWKQSGSIDHSPFLADLIDEVGPALVTAWRGKARLMSERSKEVAAKRLEVRLGGRVKLLEEQRSHMGDPVGQKLRCHALAGVGQGLDKQRGTVPRG
jgi:hypothetical protein